MKKLLTGILTFRRGLRDDYRARFAHLALGQSPDCLFVACSDSRVVPNVFASTDPGDLFVVRNVGNIVPPPGSVALTTTGLATGAEAAAIDFAVRTLAVRDIVVCGHSHCGAMRALLDPDPVTGAPELDGWLVHAQGSLARLQRGGGDPGRPAHDQLSQANVLQQIDHLLQFPQVRAGVDAGTLRLHAWWFDLAEAEVLAWSEGERAFTPITSMEEQGISLQGLDGLR